MSLTSHLSPLIPTAQISAILSIQYDCSFALNFHLIHAWFVLALGVHSRIGSDSFQLLITMDIGFPTVLVQCNLPSFFPSSFSISFPFPLFFGPFVILVKVRGEALG